MGYEINSAWTRMRKTDIEELNDIIDDKYCREMEIARKLNLMKKFKEAFDKEINSLNWDNITKFMQENEWAWYIGGELHNMAIPTKEEMIARLKIDFLKDGLYEIIELGKESYSSFSGGFYFNMEINGNNCLANIFFDIAHFKK